MRDQRDANRQHRGTLTENTDTQRESKETQN